MSEEITSAAAEELRTAAQVYQALKARHPQPEWILLAEVRTRTGFQEMAKSTYDTARSIDAFAMHTWGSQDYRRVAYEIKVSRSDWLRELKDPKKRAQAYFLSNQFYFVFPVGIFQWSDTKIDALDGCGILEVHPDGSVHELCRAKLREAWPMPTSFVASLLRQAMGRFAAQREQSWEDMLNGVPAIREFSPATGAREYTPVGGLFDDPPMEEGEGDV